MVYYRRAVFSETKKVKFDVKKGNVAALLPIGVFLVLYLGLGVLFEYGMGISMGFYNIPIVVIFLIALLVACFQNRKLPFDDKLVVMGRGIGDKTIVTMILIFMAAGVFVGTVGRDSAESVAYLMLSIIPAEFSVAVLFVVSCFVSISMGTSVGTITLITPIAVAVSAASGFSLPLCVGSVMGGAMFGDNLSFISDTTIAACQGQGCQMKDKFRENFKIALPAAIVTLVLILALSLGSNISGTVHNDYNLIELVPYLIVLVGGILGINVFVVLLLGILSGSIIVVAEGAVAATDLLGNMGTGAAGMFETTMVAVLVSAICALIRENGGFVALLAGIKRVFKGRKGGQLGMGLLVGHRHGQQHRGHRDGEPHRPRDGRDLRHLPAQDRIHLGYLLLRVPGSDSLRRPDARGHLRLRRVGLQCVGVPDHAVSVLSVLPAVELAGVHLPRAG